MLASSHVVLDFIPPEPRVRGNVLDSVETANTTGIPARSRALGSPGVMRMTNDNVKLRPSVKLYGITWVY